MGHGKAQAAMEYLTTYIWAIVVIGIVLAIAVALGLFNPQNYGSKALPGSCRVQTFGSGLSALGSLTGLCNGAPPEFVMQFSGPTAVTMPNTVVTSSSNALTITGWVYFTDLSSSITRQILLTNPSCSSCGGVSLTVTNTLMLGQTGGSSATCYAPFTNQWYFLAITMSNTVAAKLYVNGTLSCTASYSFNTINGLLLGHPSSGSNNGVVGYLSNFQFYNTTLSLPTIQALFDEGIGGEPIIVSKLDGWWPLNSNVTDYSANGNNAIMTSGSWLNSYPYTQPGHIIVPPPLFTVSSSTTLVSSSSSSSSVSSTSSTTLTACGCSLGTGYCAAGICIDKGVSCGPGGVKEQYYCAVTSLTTLLSSTTSTTIAYCGCNECVDVRFCTCDPGCPTAVKDNCIGTFNYECT